MSNPRHLEKGEYSRLGRPAALATAHRDGAHVVSVSFPAAEDIAAYER